MKRKTLRQFIPCSFVGTLCLWCLFFTIAPLFKEAKNEHTLNTAFVAAGALFTACAFSATAWTLYYQHKTELKKTSLDIFTTVYSGMMSDPKFNSAFNYLLKYIHKESRIVKEQETIDQLKADKIKINTSQREVEITRYNSILYFCEKMEYLGILIYNEYLDISLLYNNGLNIICAYKVLENWSLIDGANRQKYIHFRYLVCRIEKENNKYIKHCNQIERMILKHEKNKALRSLSK